MRYSNRDEIPQKAIKRSFFAIDSSDPGERPNQAADLDRDPLPSLLRQAFQAGIVQAQALFAMLPLKLDLDKLGAAF